MRNLFVTVKASERELGSIIADLLDHKGVSIENVTVEEVIPHTVNKPKQPKKGGEMKAGTTGTIEVIKLLKSGRPVTSKTFSDRMKALGMATTTQYSALTRFIKQGYVEKLASGEYKATESGLTVWRAQ